jgi:hypothetical protein
LGAGGDEVELIECIKLEIAMMSMDIGVNRQ